MRKIKVGGDTGSSRHTQCESAKYFLSTYVDAENRQKPSPCGPTGCPLSSSNGISKSAPFFESSGLRGKVRRRESGGPGKRHKRDRETQDTERDVLSHGHPLSQALPAWSSLSSEPQHSRQPNPKLLFFLLERKRSCMLYRTSC